MAGKCILAIDQGTSNTKALIVDECGAVRARASRPVPISYPQPGWVEQDPCRLWESVKEAASACLDQLDPAGRAGVAAVGITNQRESALAWERATGEPVGPCIVWQCRRTAPFCDDLKGRGLEGLLRERTGLQVDPLFSASKMRWLLDHIENGHERAGRGSLCAGTVDSWLLWNITGGATYACDLSNAARTQLLDLRRGDWDEDLCALFGVPRAALPTVHPSSHIYGAVVPGAIEGLPAGVPVAAMIGDSHAALYGHAGFRPGTIKATYGTGSSLMMPTAAPVWSTHGLSTTIAWAREAVIYALEGNISVTGAAVEWLAKLFALPEDAAGVQRLAAEVADPEGVYFVPAFTGLGAPHWNQAARGTITGLTRGTTRAHLARATLDSIAYQVRDVFDAMCAEAETGLNVLLADGGASSNSLLMQFQADILGCAVERSLSGDVSALGAAYLAGLAAGLWRSEEEITQLVSRHERFEPHLDAGRREALYAGWQQAVAQATHV